jgi:hypothetical protein
MSKGSQSVNSGSPNYSFFKVDSIVDKPNEALRILGLGPFFS